MPSVLKHRWEWERGEKKGEARGDRKKRPGGRTGQEKVHHIAKARLLRRVDWGGGRRAQACLLSSAIMFARCSSLNTLNCGSQPLRTRARAIFGAVSWWLKPWCTSSLVLYPSVRKPIDLLSMHSVKRWAAVWSPCPHGQLGVVISGTFRRYKNACKPIFFRPGLTERRAFSPC